MNRRRPYILPLLLFTVLVIPAADAVGQQTDRPLSLVDRLTAFRAGWGSDASDDAAPVRPPQVSRSSDTTRGRLPRVNPMGLLPGAIMDGVGSNAGASPQGAPRNANSPAGNVTGAGSTRARLLRDMRQGVSSQNAANANGSGQNQTQPVPPTHVPRSASRSDAHMGVSNGGESLTPAPARAGSILSNPPAPARTARLEPTQGYPSQARSSAAQPSLAQRAEALRRELVDQEPANSARNPADEALRRSVAADVAASLAEADDQGESPNSAASELMSSPRAEEAQSMAVEVFEEPDETMAPEATAVQNTGEFEPDRTRADAAQDWESIAEPTANEARDRFVDEPVAASVRRQARRDEAPATGADATIADLGDPRELEPSDAAAGGVLLSQRMPLLASRVMGPRTVVVGREAEYRVVIANRGEVAAERVVTEIRIPEWAEVTGITSTTGTARRDGQSTEQSLLHWELDSLAASDSATLKLTLVANVGRPLELGVTSRHAPVDSHTIVEVQEPKLTMRIAGPEEALFGKSQLYQLTISNPGTGRAENVTISLLPPGAGAEAVSSHHVGDLDAGASRTVEIELTAREAGELAIKANATAVGGLKASAEKSIFCRKPELKVDWRGPKQHYVGAPARYYFRVRNPGTAAAEGVNLTVTMPTGFQFVGASDGHAHNAERRQVVWRVGTLRPGDDFYLQLEGTPNHPGALQLEIAAASSDGATRDAMTTETDITALADLKLEVLDPKGPVAVGQDAQYEIRIKNRGANAAEHVTVVAMFSEGIEPIEVAGVESTITDGRVTFAPIAKIAAGQEVVYRMRARAHQAGAHRFRVEVICRDLETKLAAEETTRFYQTESVALEGSGQDDARFSRPR